MRVLCSPVNIYREMGKNYLHVLQNAAFAHFE
jgi:hypothetical protein